MSYELRDAGLFVIDLASGEREISKTNKYCIAF